MKQRIFICGILSIFISLQGDFSKNKKNEDFDIDQFKQKLNLSLQKPSVFLNPMFDFDFISQDGFDQTFHLPQRNYNKKRFGRAVLEFFGLMAYSQTRYWIKYTRWIEDWQFKFTWKDQKKRFFSFEAYRFDSNPFVTNWTHILSGALYYSFPRTNNLNLLESFLFNLSASSYWEYLVEWREIIGVNDNIFTGLGGLPLGECWYQFGRYFNNRSGVLNQIIGFLNPIIKLNQWLDRKQLRYVPPDIDPGWHEFDIFLGFRGSRLSTNNANQGNFHGRIHLQMIHFPEYGRINQFSRRINDTHFSELYLDFTAGKNGIEDYSIFARVFLWGYLKQHINKEKSGYSCYLGLGSAFTHYRKHPVNYYDSRNMAVYRDRIEDLHLEEPRDFRDKLSAIHLIGPAFDLSLFSGESRLRLIMDAYLDFAMINALPLNTYSVSEDISGTKTTLLYFGYYYGLGVTFSTGITVDHKNFKLKGLLKYQYYNSIEGMDRFQEELTDDYDLRDSRLLYSFSLGVHFKRMPVEFMVSIEGIDRRGSLDNITQKEFETRIFCGFNFRF